MHNYRVLAVFSSRIKKYINCNTLNLPIDPALSLAQTVEVDGLGSFDLSVSLAPKYKCMDCYISH